jgi:recombination protein RecA
MSNDNVKSLLESVDKQFGTGSLRELGGDYNVPSHGVISTGSLALNDAIGIGGIPAGVVTEIVGTVGAAELMLQLIAEAQRAGGVTAYVDLNHRFDVELAKRVGVDVERLLVSQPSNAEQAVEITDMLARSGVVRLIIVDSADAMATRTELEGDAIGDGDRSRLLGRALRGVTAVAYRTGVAIVFLRSANVGGNALKFYSSVRVQLDKVGDVVIDQTVGVGSCVRAHVMKNKFAPPFREATFEIRTNLGIDRAADLLDYAVTRGVLSVSGPTHALEYRFGSEFFARGREVAREAIARVSQGGGLAAQIRDAVQKADVRKSIGE